MNITPKTLLIESGIGNDIAVMLQKAIEAHVDTGRSARVTFTINVRTDAESGNIKAFGRVQAVIPTGDSDAMTKKLPSVGLLTITKDHPGQAAIPFSATPAVELSDEPQTDRKTLAAG